VVVKVLDIPKASLGNWVRLASTGQLRGAGGDGRAAKVSPEQVEIVRLRAENARLRMEHGIAKRPRRTSRRTCCAVHLDSPKMNKQYSVSVPCGCGRPVPVDALIGVDGVRRVRGGCPATQR